MKLSLEIIGACLPEAFRPRCVGNGGQALTLGRPRLYEPGSPIVPGRLYIARTQALVKLPPVSGAAFICDGSRVPAEWTVSDNQFLLLSNSPAPQQLLNMVQDIFDRYDALDNAIIAEFTKNLDFDMANIVRYSSDLLENPLSVTDAALNNVFSTHVTKADGVTTFSVSAPHTMHNLDSFSMIKSACLLERELRKPYMTSVEYAGRRNYCYNLYYLDVFLGCAWITEENRPFRPGDFQLAEHVFNYLQHACIKRPVNAIQRDNRGSEALQTLLNHGSLSEDEYDFFQAQPEGMWSFFHLRALADRKAMPKDYMQALLNTLMKDAVCPIIFNQEIVGLLRLPAEKSAGEELLSTFRSILQRMDYVGGISNPFQDVAQIENAYLEAGFALDRLIQTDADAALGDFREHSLAYMLSRVTGELPLSELYTDNLLRLFDYDRRHNTDYLKTLNVYLQTEMNATLSAKLLFIHRSSFLKRLEKITALLGDDLEDPQKRLYYRLIFAAWEAGYSDDPADER